ncbi:hypothetical protein F5887DRAFT_964287 [Amanita rubescens]|nr:hypothetical protein F5887DRAFT_964287 [Amanita rubescens]
MNFFDTYELSTPASSSQPQQSLNEEVTDVIGQFGRFWGTFRKQSQTALEIARRDLGGVVSQAQREINKLTTSEQPQVDIAEGESDRRSITPTDHETPPETTSADESNASSSTFLSRLIPPNIASTVRSHLPETLKHASENLDFAQLQSNLMSELQRVQGLTRAQAEEYVHKSESLLREAVREAGVALREAVKIVPPEEAASSSNSAGAIWDGTDMWMLPSEPGVEGYDATAVKDGGDHASRQAAETQRAVATRAEALLRRLKHDPSIIRHDPENDEAISDYYYQWLSQEVDAKGGIDGPHWSQTTTGLLEELNDGPALKQTQDTLVPSEITREIFWKRFFFRMHQISQEEERRKVLIESTAADVEEDLSWGEDDDEEAGSPTTISPRKQDAFEVTAGGRSLDVTRSSSREGSEASYDVVSNGTSGEKGGDEEESDWE